MKNFFNILASAILACLGLVIIFLTVYLFGWDFLSTYLIGNDIGMAYTAASWFDHFFPYLPQWFPLHGIGVSLFQGNQIGAPLLTIITARLLPLNLAQAMHLWEFLAVYLTALGIAVYVRVKFKSWTAAIIAGVFYPLSHASWGWLSEIGLYANAIAFIFFPPAILTLDLFLSELLGARRSRRLIFWFSLTCFLAASALFIHFTAGVVLLETLVVYAVSFAIFSFFSSGRKIKELGLSIGLSFLMVITSLLLVGFLLFPFLRYIHNASRNMLPVWSFEQIPYITLSALFGFSGRESLSHINSMWYVFFSRPVWVLGILGIIMAILKKNRTALLTSILFVFFVFYAIAPGVTPWLVKTLIIFWRDIYIRSLTPAIIFLPVLAAWGCLSLGQTMGKLIPKLNLTVPLSLIIAVLALYFLRGAPPNGFQQWPCYQGFGRWWRTGINYCHFWDPINLKINSLRSFFPPEISSKSVPFNNLPQEILAKLNFSPEHRLDISPKQGALIGVWSITSNTPILTLYWYALTLNNIFWGYQQNIYYDSTSIEPWQAIPELASWFGIRDVLLNKSDDPVALKNNAVDPYWKYLAEDWEDIFEDPERNILIKRFKRAPGLVTWTNRPTILVIGNRKKQAYEQVFRRATGGALPYEKALLVEGRDDGRIDQYTLEELAKFDALILYGQVYENKEKADKLLEDYVKNGGRLFIESGWQYTNSEWQTHQTLNVVPLKQLAWNQGPTTNLKLVKDLLDKKFDVEKFATFIYYSDTWNVTTASLEDIKDWGQVVLERNGKPIIMVGNLGQGRIVWSGMNLFGHLNANPFFREEWDFSQNLFDWLLEGKEKRDLSLSYTRRNPDKIEFGLNESISSYTSLLWRENFYPDWKASLRDQNLPIYRAGPNLMLLRLPKTVSGERINLEFKLSPVSIISGLLSLITLFGLTIFVAAPRIPSAVAGMVKTSLSRFLNIILEDKEE